MAEFWRKYATATHIYIPVVKRGVVDFAVGADWTPVAGDVKVSIDGGAVANVATLPVAIASGNGAFWDFALSSGETTGKKISVITVDAATKAVEDQMFDILTYGNASAELVPDYSAALATPTNITAGTITTVGTLTTYTGNTPQTGDAFARLGAPIGASISADIAEVEAETDFIVMATAGITYTVANQVDVNVVDWKGATAPAMTGDAFARLGAPAGASVSADIAAIKSDTGTILTDVNTGAGAIFTRLGAPAGASMSADIAAVEANAVAIKTQTDKMAFTVTNKIDANVLNINGNATAAANLEENVENCPRGTCSGGTNTTAVVSSMTTPASLTAAGQIVGRTIVFDWDTTTAALQGQASNITNSTTGATPTITFGALTAGTVPANGDTFSIV